VRICVYGAGAIGGYLAVKLAEAGCKVSVVARGAHLAAIEKNGLTLLSGAERTTVRMPCAEDPGELGVQDHVIITLKAHSVSPIVERMIPLLGDDTSIVTAQNGILWWYFHGFPGPLNNHRLEFADPGGRIWDTLGPERAIGCVVYPSCEIVEPGVVRHVDNNRFMLGEPDGSRSARVVGLSEALSKAGFKAPVRKRIRDDIWLKLWGNATFNPISVLTLANLEDMCRHGETREVIRRMMTEARRVGEALGVKFPVDEETRIQWGEDVGPFNSSMLQDLEAGRPLEIDALVASVVELGRLVDLPTPTIETILALVRLRAKHQR
jgi:2-dehydropantoate 2-reductase